MISHPAMKTIIALTDGGLVSDEAAGEITWDFSIFTNRRRWRDDTDRRRTTFPSSVTARNSFMTGAIWEGNLERCLLAPYKQCWFHICTLSNLSLLADSTLQLSTISRVLGATRRGRRLITTSSRAEQYSIIRITSVRVIHGSTVAVVA